MEIVKEVVAKPVLQGPIAMRDAPFAVSETGLQGSDDAFTATA